MRRVRTGEIVAAAGAVVLLISMFLDWYAPSVVFGALDRIDFGFSAWEAFGVIDLLLGLVALLGLALLAFQFVGRGPALPVAIEVVTSTLALIAFLLVAYRILNQPGPNDLVEVRFGAWLGLVSVAVVFWGAWKALSDERPRPADPPAPEPERRTTPA
jgi:hypothetical protein